MPEFFNAAQKAEITAAPSMVQQTTAGGAKKEKVLICGRERVVTKVGRSKLVVVNGKKVTLTQARAMDSKYKADKKKANKKL